MNSKAKYIIIYVLWSRTNMVNIPISKKKEEEEAR